MSPDPAPILVTGATGYIGGRLVPRLLATGRPVRCLVRDARKLAEREWARDPRLTVIQADAQDTERVAEAMTGCGAAYYLIHSMIAAGRDYAERDRVIARSFAAAAERAGLPRILYLGGLGERGRGLSRHLESRCEVEDVLRSGGVPVTTLRAAMIIGSGSASFEILRYLVERLPVMVTPRWVATPAQPIAVRDALHYLIASLDEPRTIGRGLDIGGPDVMTYREIIEIMAEVLELPPRRILPVPVLTPKLSSLWIHLVTPLSAHIARPLAEGLRNPVVCRDDEAHRLMPHERLGVRDAVALAV
ncbi:MAG TPA: NAD(P)H-binding protein, partial [bacterium]|nr:NAD(P)H-binding protein [bacterium]